ncbi:MAG: uroporphyrinogen-III synthase [Acidimicrobiales bacterium]
MTGALSGCTIGVTGDRRWQEQAEMLARRGATVVHGPVMRTGLLHDAGETLDATRRALCARADVIVLSTGIGTRSWLGVAESHGLDGAVRAWAADALVWSRGPKARSAAIASGIEVHWQAVTETSAEVVAELAARGVAGKRVVVQRDGSSAPRLAESIAALGADTVDVPVYRWDPPEDAGPGIRLLEATAARRVHAVTFTCAYAVDRAFDLAPDPDALRAALDGPVAAAAVGPVCARALRAHGVTTVVQPGRARLGAMVQALVTALSARHRVLSADGPELRWQGDLLFGDGHEAALTPTEARVLEVLVERAPGVVPKADLVEPGRDLHAAEAAVARLRTKLGPLAPAVRAVPRRGYACHLDVRLAG